MASQAIAAIANARDLRLSDFDFALPPELIAQYPLADRTASRLLHVDADALVEHVFSEISNLIAPGDVLVFNDTRVLKARLLGRKPSGGKVEALIERVLDDRRALALVRTSHSPAVGAEFVFEDSLRATVEGRQNDFFILRFEEDLLPALERVGRLPLPPYIAHAAEELDSQRYQTVYARHPGAVAAPTAGLHFSDDLLRHLQERGVELVYLTLHVGAGTFQPVRCEHIAEHRMHSERYWIEPAAAERINLAKARGARVIAVGTTAMRALESAGSSGSVVSGASETSIFITPGYRFNIVDRLITNFHLPRSTLLMLVSAFAGMDRIRAAYGYAIAQAYRFFSYGDAMLLERNP